MVGARMICWLELLFLVLVFLKTEGLNVSITMVTSEGAVCLDGTRPAYHLDMGSGDGINNWLVHLEGGGWCRNTSDCLDRKSTRLGSSNKMAKSIAFSGILSHFHSSNPGFHNWNRVKVRYCDGASFTGDRETVDPATKLYFRGKKIFLSVINDLKAKGMRNAKNALLSGCSAGGLASILHCDEFKSLLPNTTNVKCLADAGFFINVNDISGAAHIQSFFEDVVKTHNSSKNLNTKCISNMQSPSFCFFPQNMVEFIKTPLFILNAAYDSWQIKNILAPGLADPHGVWHNCKLDIKNCSNSQLEKLHGFRMEFLDALKKVGDSSTMGKFINSCYSHCQSEIKETWNFKGSPKVKGVAIADAVGRWYNSTSGIKLVDDCEYPCNPYCKNCIFDGLHN